MKKLFLIVSFLLTNLIYSQQASKVNNAQNVNTSVANPVNLLGCDPLPLGTFKPYIKDDIRWETYNINGLSSYIGTIGSGLFKGISYTPTSAEINAALGYVPYNGVANSLGFLTSSDVTGVYVPITRTINGYPLNSNLTLNKGDVGLGNVDNTSDINKPISTATQTALDGKVDKVVGKQLSTEDYTSAEKTKLAGIQAGAEVNINADWNAVSGDAQILNKPTLSTIATSGNYLDLSNRPTIPTNTNQLTNGSGFITASSTDILTNKSGNISQWTNNSGYLTGITSGQVTTALGYTPYNGTTNPLGFLTSASLTPTYNNTAVKTINGAGVQISTTKNTRVSYTITHTIALTLVLSSGSSMVFLEVSPNNSTWTSISQAGFSDAVVIAVALNKTSTNNVQGEVPAGWYVRLRAVTSGAGSATFTVGQEVY